MLGVNLTNCGELSIFRDFPLKGREILHKNIHFMFAGGWKWFIFAIYKTINKKTRI